MTELIITSSLLILVVTALRFLLRGRIILRLQYGLWALVFLRLMLPISLISSSLSVMNSALTLPQLSALEQVKSIEQLDYQSGSVIGYSSGDYMRDFPSVIAENKTEAEFAKLRAALSLKELFPRVWLTGAGITALALLLSSLRFSRHLRRTRKLQNFKPFSCESAALRACPLPVFTASGLPSPCLYGLFRPAIYIGSELLSDEKALSHVLAHENAHYRHGDNFWCLMRALCLCVYWFDPLVWLAAALSKRDAELACDEAAIKTLGEAQRADYGRTLISLSCAAPRPADLLSTATTMTGGKRRIKERVTLIAQKPKTLLTALLAVILILAVAVGCTFTGSKAAEPQTANTPAASLAPATEVKGSGISVKGTYEQQRELLPKTVTEAAENAVQSWFDSDSADFPDYKLTDWRIVTLGLVYTYETDSEPLKVYAFHYEYHSDAPDSVARQSYTSMSADGWYSPVMPLSSFLVCDSDDKRLLVLVEDKFMPGSGVFTSDMNLLLSQRGYDITAEINPVEAVCQKLDSGSLTEYARSGHDLMELIDEAREAIKAHKPNENQMRILLYCATGLDGAYAEAYSFLVSELYLNYPDVFADAFGYLSFEQQETAYNFLVYAVPDADTSRLGIENVDISENDKAAAERLIRESFDNEVRTLLSLYSSPYFCNLRRMEYLASHPELAPENVMIFLCDYDLPTTDKRSTDYNPYSDGSPTRYTDWQLILVRDDESSPWRVADQGY